MKKHIVICSDGTWNKPEENPKKDQATNVLRLARAIKPVGTGGTPQQVFYDWGIGSYHDSMVAGATGSGLHKNVLDAYRYIVQNYRPGDDLFLFGFSRGAYTIRSLCGLINNVGIVRRPDAKLIQQAFNHYKRRGRKYHPEGDESKRFRAAHSHASRRVKFVGVWDTVGAMGIPTRFLGFLSDRDEFYDRKIGPNVSIARHALAIDEFRSDFEPTIWVRQPNMDIQQVWFAGAHSDIGGGYFVKPPAPMLSDTPLRWMTSQARKAGLTVEPHLAQTLREHPKARLHKSRRSFYKLKSAHYRPLDDDKLEGRVLIHRSVKARYEADGKYRPKNLTRYLEDNGGWGTLVD